MRHQARLIYNGPGGKEQIHPFADQIVIGRRKGSASDTENRVVIKDPAISGRHCVIRQGGDGRFYIRDESRNGTRLQGRRLVPNVEVELQPDDRIQVAQEHFLVLEIELEAVADEHAGIDDDDVATRALVNTETAVTILVGDIKGYTTLNQRFKAADVVKPVASVFAELEALVSEFGGTIKEYQGDAIFAFWERDEEDPEWHTSQACQAALGLRQRVAELADDSSLWTLADFQLDMDWALTTGQVLITAIGGDRPTGLAMIGDVVNYAFRLEKLADEERGKILACEHTEAAVRGLFDFRPLGPVQVAGRDQAEPIFALLGLKDDVTRDHPLATLQGDTTVIDMSKHPTEEDAESEDGAH